MSDPNFLLFACGVILHAFLWSDFFFFKKSLQEYPQCQTVWTQIRIDVLLGLTWVESLNMFASVNPLETGKLLTGTLANSEDSDEMLHNAAFHLSLHYLLRQIDLQ